MEKEQICKLLPEYKGCEWQDIELPTEVSHWLPTNALSADLPMESRYDSIAGFRIPAQQNWQWPTKDVVVMTDLHADADAFINSLLASGMATKNGTMDEDLVLTKHGRKSLFVIGGDCFDKGPSNLRLITMLRFLMDQGAKVKIIAGNHDVRFFAGVRSLDFFDDPLLCHLFIRMAPKGVSFFKEVYDRYLANLSAAKRAKYGESMTPAQVRERLYPDAEWEQRFHSHAIGVLSEKKIRKETKKIRQKQRKFEELCLHAGLSLSMVYAAVNKWRELFLKKGGEYYWFFDKMKLMHSEGSFLFVHAGVDDIMAERIRNQSVKSLNKHFQEKLHNDIFGLYYGPMGNVFRSKYREGDLDFTTKGADDLLASGYTSIVHGHINRHQGQELVLRHGIVNFECDTSLDIKTRVKEGLAGRGAAATVIRPQGCVLGISVDHPTIKAFSF